MLETRLYTLSFLYYVLHTLYFIYAILYSVFIIFFATILLFYCTIFDYTVLYYTGIPVEGASLHLPGPAAAERGLGRGRGAPPSMEGDPADAGLFMLPLRCHVLTWRLLCSSFLGGILQPPNKKNRS